MLYPDLTPEQSAALEAFQAEHGRTRPNWRETLGEGWMRAAYPGELQQVRNTFGPTWLFDCYAHGWRASLPAWRHITETVDSDLPRWSAPFSPPAIGETVRVRVNGIGPAVVTGYFVQDGYLGLIVRCTAPPERFLKQWGGNFPIHAFGAEIEP